MIDTRYLLEFLPTLSMAFLDTIEDLVLIFGIATALAVLRQLAGFRIIPNWIATGWSFWWRTVPEVAVLISVYYGVGWPMNALSPRELGIFVLSLVSSAYISLVIRSALEQLDPGQIEGGLALGLTRFQALRLIVLPQLLRHLRFPMIMFYADVVKQSALLSVIGVPGATMAAYQLGSETFRYLEALIVVAALFLVYILAVERLAHAGPARRRERTDSVWWERR